VRAGGAAPEGGAAPPVSFETLSAKWGRVMEDVKQRTRTVHAFLLESAPREVSATHVVLGVRHRFHMEHLQDPKNRAIVEEAIARVLGVPFRLRFILDDGPPPVELPEAGPDTLVAEAIRRFGNPVQEIRRPE